MSDPQKTNPQNPTWERELLEKIAMTALKEQRAKRRWGIFFKLAALVYFVALFAVFMDFGATEKLTDGKRYTALVNLNGVIEPSGNSSAEKINEALQSAFEDKGTVGVVLRINSPGGSPVQSGIIYDEIRRLRKKYPDTPLYVVVEDLCASGGYYVASAADKIFVDKASVVGSIGVLIDGFGFTGAMEKLGVERRLLTAGTNKGFLDPFSPQDEAQKEHARKLLDEIHQQFITVVREGRGDRLKETPELFSGLLWTGAQSVQIGLADDFGTVSSVARDLIKASDIKDFSTKENLAERFAKRLGSEVGESFSARLFGKTGEMR
ncbi:MAG: S49 family peptidase [Candidatus Accumulibacter sp.]|jgi:protease-4|nr:S49 family peptidase [Accumulibacter sp.]